MLPEISDDAFNLIVLSEVESEVAYMQKYSRPTWPGGKSGVTIGIGYDVGQTDVKQLAKDWGGKIPVDALAALKLCCGVTGPAAAPLAREASWIEISWEDALEVYENRDIPRYSRLAYASLPNCDKLNPDCFGVLVSLVQNRGASFDRYDDPDGMDRFKEMRAIKVHMARKEFALIPAELKSMKRLWENQRMGGLLKRRDAEAALWWKGLNAGEKQPEPQPEPEKSILQRVLDAIVAIFKGA